MRAVRLHGGLSPAWRLLLGGLLCLVVIAMVPPVTAAGSPDGNVTAYRAETAEFGSVDAVARAIDNGSLQRVDELVVGETLVVAIASDRLAADMASANGSTTDRFLAALDGDASVRLLQTNPTPQQTRLIGRLGRENVSVIRNGSTTYVLVATESVGFHHRGRTQREAINGDERFIVQFGYNVTTDGGDDGTATSREFGLHPFESQLYPNGYTYEPLPPEPVQIAVNVQIVPTESLELRLTLEHNRTRSVTVGPVTEPEFRHVWLDLTDIDPGTDYTLELVHDGEVTDRYSGTVTVPRATLSNVTLTEVMTEHRVTRDGERVTERIDDHNAVNATVMLSHGGKVQVLDGACEQVGYAWVEAGERTQVTMKLWRDGTPLRSLNESSYGFHVRVLRNQGAEPSRYYNGTPVVAHDVTGRCPVPASEAPPTTTVTATPTTTASPTTATTTTVVTEPASEGTGPVSSQEVTKTSAPGQPGFTVLAGVLGGVIGVVWWRRA